MNLFNYWFLLQVWCHLAPLAIAAPDPDPDAAPTPVPVPGSEQMEVMVIPAPPAIMGWLGAIGGVIGTVTFVTNTVKSFLHNPPEPPPPDAEDRNAPWWRQLEDELRAQFGLPARVAPEKKGPPSWVVAVRVGLDGTGLEVKSFIPLSV